MLISPCRGPCPNASLLRALYALAIAASTAVANVEKVIFLGPSRAEISSPTLSLADFNLISLAPQKPEVRTQIGRAFPSRLEPRGTSTWVVLEDLVEGRRYEARVCWTATEPTSFSLDVYEPDVVWARPELVQSLANYSSSRQTDTYTNKLKPKDQERKTPVLLLHIQAAADYFTDNVSLMTTPPPALVGIILDPFVLNIVPQSLVPTAGYLLLVAAVTWFLSQWIASSLQSVARSPTRDVKKHD